MLNLLNGVASVYTLLQSNYFFDDLYKVIIYSVLIFIFMQYILPNVYKEDKDDDLEVLTKQLVKRNFSVVKDDDSLTIVISKETK